MPVNTYLEMTCDGCGGTVTFIDERPAWKLYDYRVEQVEEAERSAKFVADHAETTEYMLLMTAWQHADYPRFVFIQGGRPPMLNFPVSKRYIDCPVCDEKIYIEKRDA